MAGEKSQPSGQGALSNSCGVVCYASGPAHRGATRCKRLDPVPALGGGGMKTYRYSVALAGAVLASLLLLAAKSASAMTGPTPSQLRPVLIEISGRKLFFPLPDTKGTKSLDGVRLPIRTLVDIDSIGLEPVTLVSDMWDWRSLFHLYGSISVNAMVFKTHRQHLNAVCFADLRSILAEKNRLEREEFIRLGLGESHAPRYLMDSDPIELGGTKMLKYRVVDYDFSLKTYDESKAVDFYVFPISSDSYLEIFFRYLGGGDPAVRVEDWRPKAAELGHAILAGLRFEGNWSQLTPCSN